MNRPLISVLITTFNRAALLRHTLEGLARQISAPCFETIVIDDGSTDDTGEVVRSYSGRLNIRYARESNAGIASARNHALFQASAPLVLMQDDDDIPDPYLIGEHLKAHVRHSENSSAILGRTALTPELARDPLMHHITCIGNQLYCYGVLKNEQTLNYRFFWGGRTSCKRGFLLSHGIFNPVFRFGCEDTELAYRLSTHGFTIHYAEKAVTTMVRGVSYDQFLQRLRKQAASAAVFYGLHPCPEVSDCIGLATALHRGKPDAPQLERHIVAARTLDGIARDMVGAHLEIDPIDRDLLTQAYQRAFASVYDDALLTEMRDQLPVEEKQA